MGNHVTTGVPTPSLRAWARTRAVAWSTARKAHAVGRLTPGAGERVWDAEWTESHPGWRPPTAANGHDVSVTHRGRHGTRGGGVARSVSEARFWAAKAERAELELAVRRGELEQKTVIQQVLFSGGARVRQVFEQLPARAAVGFVGLPDIASAQQALRALIRETLSELAAEGLAGGSDIEACGADAEGAA